MMTIEEQKLALELARYTITRRLKKEEIKLPEFEGIFAENGAAFVTLHTKENHALRGCIGTIIAHRPLGIDIAEHAIDAAFKDPRFNPVSLAELDKIEIEISVLSEPKELEYSGYEEMLEKIIIGKDGVVIKYNGYSATFLPTVWEQIPDIDMFFAHLCQKAGLPIDFYKSGKLQVLLYQSEVFSE